MNMKATALILIMALACTDVLAQEEDSKPELGLFRGGKASINFYLGPDFLSGGINTRTGGVISPYIQRDALLVNTNPAMLASLGKADVRINSRIGFTDGQAGSFFNIESELNSTIDTETNSVFDDEDNFIRTPQSQVIPTTISDFNGGLPSTIQSFAVSYPVQDNLAVSFSYSNPVLNEFQMRLNGVSTKLAQEEGTDDVAIRFDALLNIAAYTSTRTEMDITTAGFGMKVFNSEKHELFAGASFSRYSAENSRVINTELSGMVVVGFADERYFNNPQDPNLNRENGETNELFFRARGNFTDTDFGGRLSLYYRFKQRFGLSLVYADNPTLHLEDPSASSQAFLPVFVIGDDLLSGDIEVDLGELEANKPNLTTERDISDLVSPATIQIPSYFAVGLDIPFANHGLAFNYKMYLDDFRLALGEDVLGKSDPVGLGMALDFNHTNSFKRGGWALLPVRLLLLDFDGLILQAFKKHTGYTNPHITLGGSVMTGTGYVEGGTPSDYVDIMDAPTPIGFDLGRSYEVFGNMNVGFNLISYPNLAFTYSLGVSF